MLSKFKPIVIMVVFLSALTVSEHAFAKDKSSRYSSFKKHDLYSYLDEYLKSFLEDNLPTQKYASSVRRDAWERDCMRYPLGKPDPRGEKLFQNMKVSDDPYSFNIFFIGLLHIPLFHRKLARKGFKPYIICWHFQEELNVWDPLYILRDLRRNPIMPPDYGEPCIIIGDRHGKNYRISFPEPVELKKRHIKKVHFHIELLEPNLESHVQLESLKNAVFGEEIFWGQRKIYRYIQKLNLSELEVIMEGIEPPR